MSIADNLEKNKKYIINKYFSGISTNKLADEFSCNAGSIYLKLKQWGISTKKRQKFNGDISIYEPQILFLFDKGLSSLEISRELKISKPTILRVLHRNHCMLKSTVNYNNLLKDKKHCVILKYCLGQSTSSIAKEIGHSQSAVWNLLDFYNIL